MCAWISLYHWARSEVMMADRPSAEQINNDELFDNWLTDFERKMSQRSSPPKKVTPQDLNG